MERNIISWCFLFVCELTSFPLDGQLDPWQKQIIRRIILRGMIIGIMGLLLLMAAYNKPIKYFLKAVVPKLLLFLPVTLGILLGFFIGFGISFGNCFKQSCSSFEQYASITIPIISLVITIPITKAIAPKTKIIANKIKRSKKLIWVLSGALLILYSLLSTFHRLGYLDSLNIFTN